MASDDPARKDIRLERKRNVVVDAGAGTGKTEMIVLRFVELLAPTTAEPAIPIGRIAAITFTRRAAGELKYRIREKILSALESKEGGAERQARLREALAGLDNAYIGTIHSFADRLLRLRPVEARLSPGYEIVEEAGHLVAQTVERLTIAAERETLAAAAGIEPVLAAECEGTIRDYIASGFRLASEQGEFETKWGFDALVSGMIAKRDLVTVIDSPTIPAFGVIAAGAKGMAAEIRALKAASEGTKALHRVARDLDRVARAKEGPALVRAVFQLKRAFPDSLQMKADFPDDGDGWELKKKLGGDSKTDGHIETEIVSPIRDWMIARLARLQPAVVGIYEALKREREVVDQNDLLLKLRGVLAQEAHRRFYAGMFEHLFVDEFQDTDPIQADILRALVRVTGADSPRPGTITIVGDAKQSIYRFRRADIEAYGTFREWLRAGGALVRSLQANFRSVEPLITFVNDRFSAMMGKVEQGRVFDPSTGRVFYEALHHTVPKAGPAVDLIPLAGTGGTPLTAGEGRPIEAEAFARYLIHLRSTKLQVRDPGSKGPRDLRWGDVVILSYSTWNWHLLFEEFDRLGIPYAARGGSVFAGDPLVRAFILALRAITDRKDGVAQAGVFRPPLWPLSMDDVAGKTPAFQEAEELLGALRKKRLGRPPAETARDLLSRTRCLATVEGGPNGLQNLTKLRELIQVIDGLSREGKDFDAVTTELLTWIEEPPQVDAPEPVGEDVVRFLTIHQSKGLEYPVVFLWDSFQKATKDPKGSWIAAPSGKAAAIQLEGLKGDVPAGSGVLALEALFSAAEMERLAYVAVTRARDLFVTAAPTYKTAGDYLYSSFVAAPPALVRRADPYRPDAPPAWAKGARALPSFTPSPAPLESWKPAWEAGLARALRPVAAPLAMTRERHPEVLEEKDPSDDLRKGKGEGRHGPIFGTTVHRALQMIVGGGKGAARTVVQQCATESGLGSKIEDACEDVARAVTALGKIPGEKCTEFPVAALRDNGVLLLGYIDVLAVGEEIWIIDYKTDAPPSGDALTSYPEYVGQVRSYAKVLRESGVFGGKRLRTALLFTATGAISEFAPE